MYNETFLKIGNNIKKYREINGLTQQQLADKLDMSLNFIGKIKVGYNHPSLYTLIDIAKCLNIQLKDLVDFEDS